MQQQRMQGGTETKQAAASSLKGEAGRKAGECEETLLQGLGVLTPRVEIDPGSTTQEAKGWMRSWLDGGLAVGTRDLAATCALAASLLAQPAISSQQHSG